MPVNTDGDEVPASCLQAVCEACGKLFLLTADDYQKGEAAYLGIRSCESSGIYAVYVDCPHCEHTHHLM